MTKKVLIIDDDPAICLALQSLMENEGYESMSVINANNALLSIFQFHPDVIILDYMLSGLYGSDICRVIKSMSETKDIPIIMISAYHQSHTQFQSCGANDFLGKPFDIQELLDKVSHYAYE